MGKSLHRNNALNGSPFARILQIFVAAIKNRNLPTPEKAEELHEIHDNEVGQSEILETNTFSIQQSNTLYTNILSFKVPGPSVPVIPLLFMFVLIPAYEHIFAPFTQKITGIPTGITHLQRIGVGLVLSAISMAVAGIVETRRQSVAIQHNMVDSVEPLPMSVLWLSFQYAIFGGADMFTLAGLLEFFYAESSARMKSFGSHLLVANWIWFTS
ncbi:Peptide transporter PTR3-A [Tripterygium wilfordii]|uniref:Peptide transporter PTR3-A n=1 Tax=Tripterygium wilfordii TaxID=458696 RepID=A0A7J7CZ77_TRIWF|nr:Peptide transporter PTR3-A [Tripterygium wilfordii]